MTIDAKDGLSCSVTDNGIVHHAADPALAVGADEHTYGGNFGEFDELREGVAAVLQDEPDEQATTLPQAPLEQQSSPRQQLPTATVGVTMALARGQLAAAAGQRRLRG
ncbi:hypothetical protein [Sorangium sp. So ce1078]|uniref:hypothetical protein n=1 Tax=Sorangium sp. So ce1078 TaxID=3133329 RepID=UPI003F6397FD